MASAEEHAGGVELTGADSLGQRPGPRRGEQGRSRAVRFGAAHLNPLIGSKH